MLNNHYGLGDTMNMERMIKINNKVFTIISTLKGQFVEAVCPRGRRCFIDMIGQRIMHRDSLGRIQSEPFKI